MSTDTIDDGPRELDVRNIDGEPFSAIMAALNDLPEGGTLVLINSFDPKPLYTVLERRGYEYETSQPTDEEWHVSITHA